MDTCEALSVDGATRTEVTRLLRELQQLLIGIAIMQARKREGEGDRKGFVFWAVMRAR